MKKRLLVSVLLGFLALQSPVKAQTKQTYYDCSTYRSNIVRLIEKVDNQTSICVSKLTKNKNTSFTLTRYNLKTLTSNLSITVFILPDNIKMVSLNEGNIFLGGTIFYLEKRQFLRWGDYPDIVLVNKYKNEITKLLDTVESYTEQPSTF